MFKSKKGIIAIVIIALILIGGIRSCFSNDEEETRVKSSTNIEEIEFSDGDPLELYVGEIERGHINVDYDNEFSEDDIVFVSSDESVVSISFDYKGYSSVHYDVVAIGTGTATIHAETSDGVIKSEEITVTVAENKVFSIEFPDNEALEFEVGATDDGYVNIACDGKFTEDDIIFVSSDESVVTISFDSKGYSKVYYDVEAVGAGTAIIYAQSADGTVKSEELTITVTEKETTDESKDIAVRVDNTTKKITTTTNINETKNNSSEAKQYVLNTSRMKIHDINCSSVKDISPDNYAGTDDYNKAISQGYVPCKRCNPIG